MPPERIDPTQKNLLKNRILDPPARGRVKFVLADRSPPFPACG